MIRLRNPKTAEVQTVLSRYWPPKWFMSYSDMATLMMTMFIILATMLSLNIPIYFLSDKSLRIALQKELTESKEKKTGVGPGDVKLRFTEADKEILRALEKLEPKQIFHILGLEKVKELVNQLREYIKEKNIAEAIIIEENKGRVKIIQADPFLFNKGTVILRSVAKNFIDEVANFLKQNPDFNIKIEGHTDNIPIHNPRFASNWELSMARAHSVMSYLLEKHKIPVERVDAAGYGEYRPVAPNDSEKNRAKNRRVVIEIVPLVKERNL